MVQRAGLFLADGDAAWQALYLGCALVLCRVWRPNSACGGKSCMTIVPDLSIRRRFTMMGVLRWVDSYEPTMRLYHRSGIYMVCLATLHVSKGMTIQCIQLKRRPKAYTPHRCDFSANIVLLLCSHHQSLHRRQSAHRVAFHRGLYPYNGACVTELANSITFCFQ